MGKRKRSTSPRGPGRPRMILFGVDLGTTFSGAVWAQTARPEVQTPIIQWPNTRGSLEGETSEKVPTQLLYTDDGCSWGFGIPEEKQRYQWFKLDLDPEHLKQVISLLAINYPDPKALPASYNEEIDATRLTTDYLKKFREHIEKILKLKLGDILVDTTPIRYTISVPAIWSDGAKARTQQCAAAAGMGADINIVSEPEAAVIYTLDTMDPGNLKTHDKFVLCDAGGGTVDLITYAIAAMKPIVKVREAVPGSGGACGSTFLNRIFRKYLEDTLSDLDGFEADTLEAAMEEFEDTTKRIFAGDEDNVMIPVPGLADNAGKGVRRQKMTIPAEVLKDLFQPVMSTITSLVKAQLQQSKKAKAVILVGGFGQSPYLRNCIRRVIGEEVQIMQPPNGWSAVARGALLKALHEAAPEVSRVDIASRLARRAYGMEYATDYKGHEHVGRPKSWHAYKGNYTVDVMKWFVEKGDELDQNEPLVTNWANRRKVSKGPFSIKTVELSVFEPENDETAPKYPCNAVKKLITLSANLNSIARTAIPIEQGNDGENYYCLHYEIKVAFFSAHMEFSLWYKGKQYGKVDAKFT